MEIWCFHPACLLPSTSLLCTPWNSLFALEYFLKCQEGDQEKSSTGIYKKDSDTPLEKV